MDWELAERSKKCLLCHKEFSIGDHYKSALFSNDEKIKELISSGAPDSPQENKAVNFLFQTARRIEFCPECFATKIDKKEVDSLWDGKFSEKHAEKKIQKKLSKDEILSIFKDYLNQSLSASTDDERVEKNGIAYFLAIMLERKRLFAHKKDFIDEITQIRSALYECSSTGESFTIKYPLLSKETIEHYQGQILTLLNINNTEQK